MSPSARALVRTVALCAVLTLPVAVSAAGKTHAISIEGMKYVPERLEVAVGDTITWTNQDAVPHTITGPKKKPESGTINANGKWKYVARSKGELNYICRFHPTMKGMLVVK